MCPVQFHPLLISLDFPNGVLCCKIVCGGWESNYKNTLNTCVPCGIPTVMFRKADF